MRRRTDVEIHSFAKKTNMFVKPLRTGTRSNIGLAVRWDSDVLILERGRRVLVRLVLLNHNIVCGSYEREVTSILNTEWVAPLLRVDVNQIKKPLPSSPEEEAKLAAEIEETEKRLGEASKELEAMKNGARSSFAKKKASTFGAEFSVIKNLRAELLALQRTTRFSRACFGVEIRVDHSPEPLVFAFGADETRQTFIQRFEVLQKASLQRLLLLIKKSEVRTSPNNPDLLQTTAKEITELKESISDALGKPKEVLYIATMDHLPENEDEVFFQAGDEVRVIRKMSDLCWLASCRGLVGAVDPRLLIDLSKYGIDEIPSWEPEATEDWVAVQTRLSHGVFEVLEFYEGEFISVWKKLLPNGMLLGRCQNTIGLVDGNSLRRKGH